MVFINNSREKEPGIAIIGMAARFPGAKNYGQLWDNLTTGERYIREIPADRWSYDQYYHPDKKQTGKSISKWGGMIEDIYDFDHLFFHMSPREAAAMDPQQRLLLQETWHCIEDAGVSLAELQSAVTSVYTGAMATDFPAQSPFAAGDDRYRTTGNYESFLANRISYFYNLKGMSLPVNAACSSSLTALHLAASSLQKRECDYAFVSAANLNLDPNKYVSFSKMGLLSPNGECRSFQENANGYVPADGVGVLLLRRLDAAIQDRNTIYGVIKGSAVTHGGTTRSILVPSAGAQQEAMLKAHQLSGFPPESVNYVEAHGTGTYAGDTTEIASLTNFYRKNTDKVRFCRIGSLKPIIGHTEAASGIAGIIKIMLMMKHKQLPALPQFNYPNQTIDIERSPFEFAASMKEWRPEPGYSHLRAGINSYSMGGVNSYVLLEEYIPMSSALKKNIEPKEQFHIFALSCRSMSALEELAGTWKTFADSEYFSGVALQDCCRMLLTTREHFSYRFGSVISSKEELKKSLAAFVNEQQKNADSRPRMLNIGELDRKNYSNFKSWLEENRLFKSILSDINHRKNGNGPLRGLRNILFQHSWDKNSELQAFIINYCCAAALLELGFTPDVVTGMGSGLWVALVISGAITLDHALQALSDSTQSRVPSFQTPRIPFYDHSTETIIHQFTDEAAGGGFNQEWIRQAVRQEFRSFDHQDMKVFSWGSSSSKEQAAYEPVYEFKRLLLDLWMDKVDIHWKLLYPQDTFHNVPQLPGYPFEQKTHRNETNTAPRTKTPVQPVHHQEQDQERPLEQLASVLAMQQRLVEMFSRIAGIEVSSAGTDMDIRAYGADSEMLGEFAREISQAVHVDIKSSLLFEYPVLSSLAQYLVKNRPAAEPSIQADEPKAYEKKAAVAARDVAIIGMSCRFPASGSAEEFWEHLIHNDDLITPVPQSRWDWTAYEGDPQGDENKTNSRWGGFLDDIQRFDAEFFHISRREAELMDPQQRVTLEEAWHAIEDAGYKASELSGRQIGVYIAVFNNDYNDLLGSGTDTRWDGYSSTGTYFSMIPNRISYLLNLHGPSVAIETACSGSLVAIHQAASAIINGDCEQALAGGVNLFCTPRRHLSFGNAGMLASDGKCKAFDAGADGYVRGEGAGVLLMKSLEQAIQDGDHIYGVVKGSAVNHGGYAVSLTAPNPQAQSNLLIQAYERAKIDPAQVTYIEAHGTGTSLGDPIELNALKKAFAQLRHAGDGSAVDAPIQPYCAVGTVKTNIGHLESGAGIAGVIKVLLSMKHGILPGNLHFNRLNPQIELQDSPFYILDRNKEWLRLKDEDQRELPRCAGVSSFGFGGVNAHIVLQEYLMQEDVAVHPPGEKLFCPLSATTAARLTAYAISLHQFLLKNPDLPLRNIAYTLQTGREDMEERIGFLADSTEGLKDALHGYIHGDAPINGMYAGSAGNTGTFAGRKLITGQSPVNPQDKKLEDVIQQWVNGAGVDWQRLYNGNKPAKVSLPGYPFGGEAYWLPEEHSDAVQTLSQSYASVATTGETRQTNDQAWLKHLLQQLKNGEISANDVKRRVEENYGESEYES
ncbi:beta-ketoacyl synthase N-terminal-like domain-containing protein [Paenibacillus durus]|uniref:beta-ketoacyl synthase N-terminal-like domain-containing protein n=1 Tax=Paenibacillus durus TaxID=44251 RepID=UPI000694A06D|nr:beta-ketoacyl synthase N-terminal-like domain-containing protein [Paenibacillus durus]